MQQSPGNRQEDLRRAQQSARPAPSDDVWSAPSVPRSGSRANPHASTRPNRSDGRQASPVDRSGPRPPFPPGTAVPQRADARRYGAPAPQRLGGQYSVPPQGRAEQWPWDQDSRSVPPRQSRPSYAAASPSRSRPTVRKTRALQIFFRSLSILVLVVLMAVGVIHALNQIRLANPGQTPTTFALGPTHTVPPAPTPTPKVMPWLSIKGTQIVDPTGKPVTLIGATRSRFEYYCTDDGHFSPADFKTMQSWGMNVVRIPLWSKFWLNIDPRHPCPTYQQSVRAAVANAESVGMYVILDLHWNAPNLLPANPNNWQYNMPDTGNDVQFWNQVATIYKDDPNALFELYAEPNFVDWNTWLNGGTITANNRVVYQAIGMRDLVVKVRAIAPNNLIIVSGLAWGYDLSQIPNGYALAAKNIVYGTHPFDHGGTDVYQLSDWDRAFGYTATKYAVIGTEFGEYDCKTGYIGDVIHYFNEHHISWLAWEWGPGPCDGNGPFLLADWFGTPTQPYGQYIHDQMVKIHPPEGPVPVTP